MHSNGSLHIKDVQESDAGLYSCIGIRGESTEVPQSYVAELRLACQSEINKFQNVALTNFYFIDLRNLTASSFEPPLNKEHKKVTPEGSFFQLTCLEPPSLPPAKKWWLNPSGHTVSAMQTKKKNDFKRFFTGIRCW